MTDVVSLTAYKEKQREELRRKGFTLDALDRAFNSLRWYNDIPEIAIIVEKIKSATSNLSRKIRDES